MATTLIQLLDMMLKKAATALGLDSERYVPVMAIAVGKADSQSTDIKSTRYSVDDVIEFQ